MEQKGDRWILGRLSTPAGLKCFNLFIQYSRWTNTERLDSKSVQNTSGRVLQFSHTALNALSAIALIEVKCSVKLHICDHGL